MLKLKIEETLYGSWEITKPTEEGRRISVHSGGERKLVVETTSIRVVTALITDFLSRQEEESGYS